MVAEKISMKDSLLVVPDQVIIPYIEGDGIGSDIWRAASWILDAAIDKAYGEKKKIHWKEVLAGQKAFDTVKEWLPKDTLEAFKEYKVGIKGPLTTPIGGGIRSLNVAIRQELDLFACVRPVRHFTNVPAPVKHPEYVDMVIFRENTEDIYAGIEYMAGTDEVKKVISFLQDEMKTKNIRFPQTSSIGIKPVSEEGSKRLIRSAIEHAFSQKRKSVTLVHKGNIMKFTEGGFKNWGFELAKEEYGATDYEGGPWQIMKRDGHEVIIKDAIADIALQQVLTRPKEFDVIATMNLNGDYLSDALAAQVGGIGIAPGANINYDTGIAVFEATHGTAPKYAGLDKVNPCSVLLSGVMMLEYMGWQEAADRIVAALEKTFSEKKVTYDFARLMSGATELKTSEFAEAVIGNL